MTRLDHDANVAPWLAVAEERGLEVRWVGIGEADCTPRPGEPRACPRTGRVRLVAVGPRPPTRWAPSTPCRASPTLAHAAGAQLWVDAVHAAPHLSIDVEALGADFLVCSAYKFYGPHLGILWGRRELLEALPPYHVRPAGDAIPGRFETGTQAHELLAGLGGTIAYLEKVGITQGGGPGLPGQRPTGCAGRACWRR